MRRLILVVGVKYRRTANICEVCGLFIATFYLLNKSWEVECRELSVGSRVSGVECRELSVGSRVSGVECRESSVGSRVSGVECRESSVWSRVSSVGVQVSGGRVSEVEIAKFRHFVI